MAEQKSAREVVLTYVRALNDEDFRSLPTA
jgi:hypothetical protein